MSRSATAEALIRQLWRYCNVLRDDGLSYPDYVEQLTYLLFLKMADEQGGEGVPRGCDWNSFVDLGAEQMQVQYRAVLDALGRRPATLGLIFGQARDKIVDPAKLRYLVVELIGRTWWTGMSADVKGDAYEGLLEKNARDTKSGAGQYFTPRPLVDAIVECTDPRPGETINDPACGTGGFLLAAYDHVDRQLAPTDEPGRRHLARHALRGDELVREVGRLAAMNLYLHGVAGDSDAEVPLRIGDSLREPPNAHFDVVLSNPPFGTKGSVTYGQGSDAADELVVVRPDFWARTSNKQLNFLQHIVALLKPGGRAAVIVPDNVLFEGGAASAVRRRIIDECHLHTVLRLPPGLFYAAGVLASVIFFEKTSAPPESDIWVYDFRSDNRYSVRTRPLGRDHLDEFVRLYRPGNIQGRRRDDVTSRWKAFSRNKILADKDCRLDFSWEPAREETLTAPGLERVESLTAAITADLQRAIGLFERVAAHEPFEGD